MNGRGVLPLLVAAFGLVIGPPASAQEAGPLDQGDRVRVVWSGGAGEYLVQALQPDSIILQQAPGFPDRTLATRSVRRIEVYGGTSSYLTGAFQGAIAGSLFGGILTIPCRLPHGECEGFTSSQRLLVGTAVGAALGALLRGGREIWDEVRVPGQMTPVPAPPRLAGSEGAAGPSGTSNSVISRDQIADASLENAYELVQRYRSQWLRPSRTQDVTGAVSVRSARGDDDGDAFDVGGNEYAVVFFEGRRYGPLDSLEDFTPAQIEYIEFINARDATTLHGTGYLAGIINVVPRQGGDSDL